MSRPQRYKDLQLAQLRSFCLAARQGNFSETAKVLGVSRTAVWQQVRALEQRLGLTLLRRRGRAVELTADGQLVLDTVLPHVQGLESLEALVEARRAEMPQRLTVASTPSLLTFALCQPLQQFAARHPVVRLSLLADLHTQQLIARLERGEADIGVIPYDHEERRSTALVFEDLFSMPLLLLTAANHPLARQKRVRPEDLGDYPLILSHGSNPNRRMQDQVLHRHHLTERAHVVLENEHTYIVMKYVAAGLGIALWYASREMVQPQVHARVFDPTVPGLTVALAVRKHAHLSEPVREFGHLVRRHLAARRASRQA